MLFWHAAWMTRGRAAWHCLLAFPALILTGGLTHAQQSLSAGSDTNARIEQLEKEVQTLKAMLRQQSPTLGGPVTSLQPPTSPKSIAPAEPLPAPPSSTDSAALKKIIEEWSKEKEVKEQDRKKAEEEKKKREGFVVGDDVKFNALWDAGGLRFKTTDEAFSLHVGGRLMTDEVWWTQSPNLRQPPTPPVGSPLGLQTGVGPGIGDLQDGFFIRRARVVADGAVFQTIEFKVEFDFENYNSLLFDESYIGARDLPVVDTARIGQTHVPFGLEAYTSSRYLPMLERSPLFDAFYQEFAPGVFIDRTFYDQRVTTQHMFHRIDYFNQFNGASFGDGKYAYSGRISALPVYESDGRYLIHFGLAYQFRNGSPPLDFNGGTVLPSSPNPAVTTNTDLVRFRARPGLRDAVGLQGFNSRVVDTGNIIADHVQSVNSEFLSYWGPLWVQAEACLAHVDNAVFPASDQATRRGDLNYYGSYVQVGYFLTGENRGYDKRMGKYDRVRPLENFFLVRDENGRAQYGLGAWEIVYRYGFVNLNDDFIRGGIYSEHTAGLNWYWTPNIKLQMNYINGQRSVPAGAVSGNIQGIALRAALEF
jgi:phosphate-selective porin OprO and OprP